jgi:hypothetical protein
MENKALKRDIKLNIILGKYKAISAYKVPDNPDDWLECPNCHLIPLTWTFNNGSSTACGCGENEYRHFSIWAESIMSHVSRNNGSALNYNSNKLMINWNHWVRTGMELESREKLLSEGKW